MTLPRRETLEERLRRLRTPSPAPQETLAARLERLRTAKPATMRRDVQPRGAQVRADATGVTPREDKPNILKRTGTAAKEFAREVKKNPVKTVATMIASPLKSASDAFIAPSVGESRRTSADRVTGRDKEGFDIVQNVRTGRTRRLDPAKPRYDAEHGAVTGKQRAAGLAQVAAEVVAGPIAGKVTKLAKPVVGKTAARAAGGVAAGAPIGAVNAPDDPGVGAIFGTALGAAAGVGVPAARDKLVEAAPRAAARVRAGVRAGTERVRGVAERLRALRERTPGREQTPEHVTNVAENPPERVVSAAMRLPDGSVFEGLHHAAAWDAAVEAGKASKDVLQGQIREHATAGFVTDRGRRFVDQKEALRLVLEGKQVKQVGRLNADDIAGGLESGDFRQGRVIGTGLTATPRTTVARIPTSAIDVDAARFQFKQVKDPATGTSGELKSVETFNPDLAGVIAVWKDPANGRTYVVNGHHRVELARRTGHPEMDVRYIEAPRAEAARATGALINIAEGRGTPVDVAKFLRDTGTSPDELAAKGVSLRGNLARDGVALGRLAPDLFDRVARGEIEMRHAVAIGSMLDSPELQRAALQLIEGKRLTDSEVVEVARQARDAGSESVTEESLFGTEEMTKALIVERAQLAASIKKRLSSDRRTFGFVTKGVRAEDLARGGNVIDVEQSRAIAGESAQLEEIFDRLYTRSGPVADALNEGARRIAHGARTNSVADELYDRVRAAVAEALRGGEGPHGPPGRGHAAERAIEPGPGDATAELAQLRDSVDPNQSALLSPRAPRGPPSRDAELREALETDGHKPSPDDEITENAYGIQIKKPHGSSTFVPFENMSDRAIFGAAAEDAPRDLFGERVESGPTQTGLFGAKEGTAAARSLTQTEAAARGELTKLRESFRLEQNPERRTKHAQRIAELEKLVNRDKAITADEMKTRAAAKGLDQETLFSPATRASPLGKITQKVGQKVRGQPPAAEVKSLREISVSLAKMVGVPLRRGRFAAKRRGALGAFWLKSEVTRVQKLRMVDTVAHEVGHFLSKKYLRNPTTKLGGRGRSLPKGAGKELVTMGSNLYGSRRPAMGYGEEGIAEWTSFYVTEPHRLPVEAPIFTKFMETVLENEPALKAALDQAADDFARYEASPANEKVAAMISVGEETRFRPTAKWFMRNVLDDLEEFREATNSLGASKDPARNAYALARLTRGDGGLAQDIVQRGAVDFASKQRVSRGLEEILKDVGAEHLQAFREYLVAERTLEKSAQGIDTGVDLKASQAVATQGRKQFQQHAAELWAYSNGNLAYLRDAGLLTPGEFQAIAKKNQKRVPFYRVIDPAETGAGQGTGRSFVRSSSGIHKLRGSDRTIIDPLESLVGETYRLISRANKHHAAQTMIRQALATEGGGALVELLPEIPQEMRRIDVAKVREQLDDLGFTPPDDPAELAALGDAVLSAFYEKPRPGAAETRDLVMTVLVEGERRWVAIKDRELWNGIQHMDVAEVEHWGMKILESVNKTLRIGATISPDFSATNPIRDMFHTAIFSRGPTRPPGYHFMKGIFSAFKQDALFQRFMQEGGMNAGLIGFDRRSHQRQLRQVTDGKLGKSVGKALLVAKHPIETLRLMSELMENANRMGEFKSVRGQAMRQGTGEVSASKEGALAARDLIDFAQAGVQVRAANRIIAFLNAHVRDTAKLVQEHAGLFSRNPARRKRAALVMARATAWLTVPSIALYLAQRNNPAYQDVPEWAKNTGWIVMLPGGRYVWIPRPFFLGTLYGRLPELALEAIDGTNPEALEDAAGQLAKGVTPPVIPTAAKPLIENLANKSFFRDRPIVPRSVEGLDPSEQSRERTGETARQLGDLLDYSPAKIENLVTGYSGGLGRYGLQAVDIGVTGARAAFGKAPERPQPSEGEGGVTEIPVARRFVHAPPGEDAEGVERIHRQFQVAERRRLTWRMKLKRGDVEGARRYLEEHRAEILSVATREDTGGKPGPLRASYEALTELRGFKRDVVRRRGDDARHRAALIEQKMVQLGRQHRERENARP